MTIFTTIPHKKRTLVFVNGRARCEKGEYEKVTTSSGNTALVWNHIAEFSIIINDETLAKAEIDYDEEMDYMRYITFPVMECVSEYEKKCLKSKGLEDFTFTFEGCHNSWGTKVNVQFDGKLYEFIDLTADLPQCWGTYILCLMTEYFGGTKRKSEKIIERGESFLKSGEFIELCFETTHSPYWHIVSPRKMLSGKIPQNVGVRKHNEDTMNSYFPKGKAPHKLDEATVQDKMDFLRYYMLEKARKNKEEREREAKSRKYHEILENEGYWSAWHWAKRNNFNTINI